MKAVVCEAYGPIEELHYRDFDEPVPGDLDCIVEAEAIGCNFPDGLLVQGLYQARPEIPFVPGMEVVGRIVGIGDKVRNFNLGDRVAGLVMTGGYAEKVLVPAVSLMKIPDSADAGQVTALICGYGTAMHALKQRADLKAGETLVVTGASGLTGLAAIQIGKAMGAKVIAVASTDEKRAICSDNGADACLGYGDLKDVIRSKTDGKGADVIFEVVGGDVFDLCARSVAWGGRLLVIGFASGKIPKFPVNLALLKGYSVVGVFWGDFTAREPAGQADNMKQLLDWYQSGAIAPFVKQSFQLAEAAKALEIIHNRGASGKFVLLP